MADETPVVVGDGIVTIPAEVIEENEMPGLEGSFQDRLLADRDRHSTNATSLEKILELQYASETGFRAATSARIVLEAGAGRTRAETNGPSNTAAAGHEAGK